MKKVLVVVWRHSGRRTVLADYSDRTVKVNVAENKADAESIQRLPAAAAWEEHPPDAGIVWSPLAMAALIIDLEKSGKDDLARKALRVYRERSSVRRISQLRILMGRKTLERRKR